MVDSGIRTSLMFIVLAAAATAGVSAQERQLSIDDAIGRALEQNHALEAMRADARSAEAVAGQARSARYPVFSAQGGYTRLSDNIPSLDVDLPAGFESGGGTFELAPIELNRYQSQLGISQTLFSGFRIAKSVSAASHTATAAEYEARQTEVDLAYQVRTTYWELVRAQSALEVVHKAEEAVESLLEDTQNRFDLGAATRSDVSIILTRRADLRVDRLDAEHAVRLAGMELNRLMGEPLTGEIEPLDTDFRPSPEVGDLVVQTEGVADRHPGLQALEQRIQSMDDRVSAARADWFPDVTAFGRYVYARPNSYFFLDQDEFRGSWEAGVTVSWTLWDWNRRPDRVREARSRRDASIARYEDVVDQVRLEAARQALAFRRAQEAVDASVFSVSEAETGFELMVGEAELGVALNVQVLEAETALRKARLRQVQATADLAIAHAGLLRVLGRME